MTLIELFQSQDCQNCPIAVPAIVKAAREKTNRLLLTYNVTSSEYDKWNNTLASGPGADRQRAYVERWGRSAVYTPQVVVDGLELAERSGASAASRVSELVERAKRARSENKLPWSIYLDANDTEIRIDTDAPAADEMASASNFFTHVYDILVVTFRVDDHTIAIGKGSNKGRTLLHSNAVTDITKVGEWQGGNLTLKLPMSKSELPPGTDAVVFLQEGPGGPIVAVTKV